MPLFSVIIVNFNGGDYLQKAITSLQKQTCQDFEVFVVDNASTDGSMASLDVSGFAEPIPVQLMREGENHGFAKGNNIAAQKAKGDWLVLLNPDAVAAPDWLERISDGIQRHPDTKMFASLQYALEDPDRMDGAGDSYHVFGIPWRGGYGRSAHEVPGEGECFSPCGAGAVFERQAFIAIGGFNEDFFCYCEDVDLGFRLRLNGERCVFLPSAVIHHAGSAISNQIGHFAVFHGTRNRFWTFVRNTPPLLFWLMLLPHMGMTTLIYLRGIQTGRAKTVRAGFTEAAKNLKPVIDQRKAIQSSRKIGTATIIKSMAWNPITMLTRRVHIFNTSDN